MKSLYTMVFILLIMLSAGCGTGRSTDKSNSAVQSSDTGRAVLSFSEAEHNFGKVVEGEKVGCIFLFKNAGTSDMVITRAVTTCGCTIPKYDTQPIPPGGSGKLEVIFNTSGYSGIQNKSITVHSNAEPPVVILKINAEVINSSN